MNTRQPRRCWQKIAALLALWLAATPLLGVTLEDLRRDSKLTPQRFARYFADFQFKYHTEVQAPEVFLASESGDCDDYATLAAMVLSEKGYTTRLVTVRMPGVVHVVCYVAETGCYLDYNNREFLIRTVGTNGSLADIARKVAWSFGGSWTSASEFTFQDGVKRTVTTVARDGTRLPMQLAQRTLRNRPVSF
ncbi:MAG: transglutaminase-like domain-containing protein [Limisphaerales bacterium]